MAELQIRAVQISDPIPITSDVLYYTAFIQNPWEKKDKGILKAKLDLMQGLRHARHRDSKNTIERIHVVHHPSSLVLGINTVGEIY